MRDNTKVSKKQISEESEDELNLGAMNRRALFSWKSQLRKDPSESELYSPKIIETQSINIKDQQNIESKVKDKIKIKTGKPTSNINSNIQGIDSNAINSKLHTSDHLILNTTSQAIYPADQSLELLEQSLAYSPRQLSQQQDEYSQDLPENLQTSSYPRDDLINEIKIEANSLSYMKTISNNHNLSQLSIPQKVLVEISPQILGSQSENASPYHLNTLLGGEKRFNEQAGEAHKLTLNIHEKDNNYHSHLQHQEGENTGTSIEKNFKGVSKSQRFKTSPSGNITTHLKRIAFADMISDNNSHDHAQQYGDSTHAQNFQGKRSQSYMTSDENIGHDGRKRSVQHHNDIEIIGVNGSVSQANVQSATASQKTPSKKDEVFKKLNLLRLTTKFLEVLRQNSRIFLYRQLRHNHFRIINDKCWYPINNSKEEQTILEQQSDELTIDESPKWHKKHINKSIKINKKNLELEQSFTHIAIKICHQFLKKINRLPTISPDSSVSLFWNSLILLSLIFLLFYIPIQSAFNPLSSKANSIISNAGSILIVMDIIIKLNTGFLYDGYVIQSRTKIILYNLRFRFWFSLLSIILLNLTNHGRLVFVINVSTVSLILEKFDNDFQFKQRFFLFYEIFRLVFLVLFIASTFGSLFYLISKEQVDNGETKAWILTKPIITWVDGYLYSLYFMFITMSTVGYGDLVPQNMAEVVFVGLITLLGSCLFAYCINSIGNLLSDIQQKESFFKQRKKDVGQYLSNRNISRTLQVKVMRYLEYLQTMENSQSHLNAADVVKYFSDNLRFEVNQEFFGNLLRKSKVFGLNFTPQFLNALSQAMKELTLAPGEILYHKNETDQRILFVISGDIELFEKEIRLRGIAKGETLNYRGFFGNLPHSSSARSLTISHLSFCSRIDFMSLLKTFPQDFETFCYMRDSIMQYNHSIDSKCCSCQSYSHIFSDCPLIHYTYKIYLLSRLEDYAYLDGNELTEYLTDKEFYRTLPSIKVAEDGQVCQQSEENSNEFDSQDLNTDGLLSELIGYYGGADLTGTDSQYCNKNKVLSSQTSRNYQNIDQNLNHQGTLDCTSQMSMKSGNQEGSQYHNPLHLPIQVLVRSNSVKNNSNQNTTNNINNSFSCNFPSAVSVNLLNSASQIQGSMNQLNVHSNNLCNIGSAQNSSSLQMPNFQMNQSQGTPRNHGTSQSQQQQNNQASIGLQNPGVNMSFGGIQEKSQSGSGKGSERNIFSNLTNNPNNNGLVSTPNWFHQQGAHGQSVIAGLAPIPPLQTNCSKTSEKTPAQMTSFSGKHHGEQQQQQQSTTSIGNVFGSSNFVNTFKDNINLNNAPQSQQANHLKKKLKAQLMFKNMKQATQIDLVAQQLMRRQSKGTAVTTKTGQNNNNLNNNSNHPGQTNNNEINHHMSSLQQAQQNFQSQQLWQLFPGEIGKTPPLQEKQVMFASDEDLEIGYRMKQQFWMSDFESMKEFHNYFPRNNCSVVLSQLYESQKKKLGPKGKHKFKKQPNTIRKQTKKHNLTKPPKFPVNMNS